MLRKSLSLAAAAALTVIPGMMAANAGPASFGLALPGDAAITKVQFAGPECFLNPLGIVAGAATAVASALSGGCPVAPFGTFSAGWGPSWDARMAACFANFRSFDPVSGTYITYEGFQVVCPFLVQ